MVQFYKILQQVKSDSSDPKPPLTAGKAKFSNQIKQAYVEKESKRHFFKIDNRVKDATGGYECPTVK